MLTFIYNASTVPTIHGLIQCGCTKRLQNSPGLWADFTPWRGGESISHCLTLPGQKRAQGSNILSWWKFLPLLPPNDSDWQNKERTTVCTETLQKITCWEGREQVLGPSQPAKVGTHIHQLLRSELALGGSRRGKEIWEPASLSGTEQLWLLRFAFRRASWQCFFLAVTDCYEMHKQCRRRPSCLQKATYYRIYFAAVCKELKKHIRTDCHLHKNLRSAGLGFLCFGFHFLFILFLSHVYRKKRSLLSQLGVNSSPPNLSIYVMPTDDPKASPKIWPKSLSHVQCMFSFLFCANKHRSWSMSVTIQQHCKPLQTRLQL